jgi:hypothetical protein
MALGEQIMLDKAGPQFTYEIRWESDMSTSIIRPNEVSVRMVRPALPTPPPPISIYPCRVACRRCDQSHTATHSHVARTRSLAGILCICL